MGSIIICFLIYCCHIDYIEMDEMTSHCSMNGKNKKCIQNCRKYQVEELWIDVRKILKLILNK